MPREFNSLPPGFPLLVAMSSHDRVQRGGTVRKFQMIAVATVGVSVALVANAYATTPTIHVASPSGATAHVTALKALANPSNLSPLLAPAFAGEGVYHPAGRTVQGHSAIFTTTIRPPDNPTTVAGGGWNETNL